MRIPQELRGKPITEFLAQLGALNTDVAALKFAAYKPEPKLSERLHNLLSTEETALRDQATTICHDSGVPFWDVLLGLAVRRNSIPDRMLDTAGAHGATPPEYEEELPIADISSQRILNLLSTLPEELGLVVSSKAKLTNGRTEHIPMLDFRCSCSSSNLEAVHKIMNSLGQSQGVIVASGRSYHFYGTQLLSHDHWVHFMGRALLFAPILDPRYIGHRLADGECRLKIASSKNSSITEIVDIHGD